MNEFAKLLAAAAEQNEPPNGDELVLRARRTGSDWEWACNGAFKISTRQGAFVEGGGATRREAIEDFGRQCATLIEGVRAMAGTGRRLLDEAGS